MTIWVVLGVLGIAVVIGVVLFLRGGSLSERRELRGELRRIRDQEGHHARGRHDRPASDNRDGTEGGNIGTFLDGGAGGV
jgi:hypothetical protein